MSEEMTIFINQKTKDNSPDLRGLINETKISLWTRSKKDGGVFWSGQAKDNADIKVYINKVDSKYVGRIEANERVFEAQLTRYVSSNGVKYMKGAIRETTKQIKTADADWVLPGELDLVTE